MVVPSILCRYKVINFDENEFFLESSVSKLFQDKCIHFLFLINSQNKKNIHLQKALNFGISVTKMVNPSVRQSG